MIDVLWGDPGLTRWEKSFVLCIARWGWHNEYSEAQKRKILQIFNKRKQAFLQKGAKHDPD